MDVTPRGDCSLTNTGSHKQAADTRKSFVPGENDDLIKDKRSNVDTSKTPAGKKSIPAIGQPNFNSKKQLEFLPNAVTVAQTSEPEGIVLTDLWRKSPLALDARPTRLGVNHGKHRSARAAGLVSKEALREDLAAGGNADLPGAPLGSDSTEVLWNQSNVVPKLRQFNFKTRTNTDASFPSGHNLSSPSNESIREITTGPQDNKLKENTNSQMNVGRALNLSSGSIKDCCFRSKLQCSDQQQTFIPAKCSTLQTKCSKSNITPYKQRSDAGQNKRHMTVNLGDTGRNQTAEGPAGLPECSSQSWGGNRPLSVEQRSRYGLGNKPNRGFDLLIQPQQRVYQGAADATPMALPPLNQPSYHRPGRAIFLEEDPYYVTMYHPSSVYVGE